MADKVEKKDSDKKQEEKTPMSLIDNSMIKEKTTIGFSACIAAVLVLMEIYVMIRMPDQLLLMGFLLIPFAIDVYVMVNAIINLSLLNKKNEKEKYDELYRAQKASYLIVKKSFEELEERLNDLEDSSEIPSDNLINAQKALAKVQLNRNKENTLAMIDSNEKLLEQIEELQKSLKSMSTEHSERQEKLFDKTTEELKKEIDSLERKLERLQDTVRTQQAVSYIMPAQVQPGYKESADSKPEYQSRFEEAQDINIEPEADIEPSDEFEKEDEEPLDLDSVQSDFEAAPSIDIEEAEENTESHSDIEAEDEVIEPVAIEDEADTLAEDEPTAAAPSPEMGESAGTIADTIQEETAPEVEPVETIAESAEAAPAETIEESLEAAPAETIEESLEAATEIRLETDQEQAKDQVSETEPEGLVPEQAETAQEVTEPAKETAPAASTPGGLDMSDPNKILSPEEIEKLFANI